MRLGLVRRRRRRGGMGRLYNYYHITVQINRASCTLDQVLRMAHES